MVWRAQYIVSPSKTLAALYIWYIQFLPVWSGQKSSACMLLCQNGSQTSLNQFSYAGNSSEELTVLIYILWWRVNMKSAKA